MAKLKSNRIRRPEETGMCNSGKKKKNTWQRHGGVSLRHAGGEGGGCWASTWLTDRKLIMERTEIMERREESTTVQAMMVGTFLPSREWRKSGEGHVFGN